MNAFDLLFGTTGPALMKIFKMGHIPVKEDFLELTGEQYAQFYREMGKTDERVYMFAPSNPQHLPDDDYNEITVATESQIEGFLNAAGIIDRYCTGKQLETDEEKLRYTASCLPDVFSKGSRYEKYHNLTVVRKTKEEEDGEDQNRI